MKSFFGRAARVENVPTIVAIIGGLAVAGLRLCGVQDPGWLMAGIGLVLSALATSILVERLVSLQRIETSLTQLRQHISVPVIETFYANRSQLPPFVQYIEDTHNEIFAVGGCLGYLVNVQMGLLARKAQEGCSIRLLLMAPAVEGETNRLAEEFGKACLVPNIGRMIESSLQRILDTKGYLAPEHGDRIEVRVHGELLTCILIFLDPNSPRGRLRVELLPYKFDATDRPGFELRRQDGGALYDLLYSKYSELWEASAPWEADQA